MSTTTVHEVWQLNLFGGILVGLVFGYTFNLIWEIYQIRKALQSIAKTLKNE